MLVGIDRRSRGDIMPGVLPERPPQSTSMAMSSPHPQQAALPQHAGAKRVAIETRKRGARLRRGPEVGPHIMAKARLNPMLDNPSPSV